MTGTAVCNSIYLLESVIALSPVFPYNEEYILKLKSRRVLLLTSEEPGWDWWNQNIVEFLLFGFCVFVDKFLVYSLINLS